MKIGIALSGGGIRGIAHAGVLKALEENNLKPSCVAGTSSGSLVAGLYAIGYTPDNIYTLCKRYARNFVLFDKKIIKQEIKNYIIKKKINCNGFCEGDAFEELYNRLAFPKGVKKLTDIKMPLIIPAVDISNSTKYILSSIKTKNKNYITDITLGEAVRASSSFPIVYKPFKYKEHLFLDGGIVDNVPAEEIKKLGIVDKIISVRFDSNQVQEESNIMEVVMKSIDIMSDIISKESLECSGHIITVPTDGAGLLDLEKLEYCFNSGYETTIKEIDKIKTYIYG